MGLRYQIGVRAEPALAADLTGTSVRDWCDVALRLAGMDWEQFVHLAPARPGRSEVEELYRDGSKARKRQGCECPTTYWCLAHSTRQHNLADVGPVPAEHHRGARCP